MAIVMTLVNKKLQFEWKRYKLGFWKSGKAKLSNRVTANVSTRISTVYDGEIYSRRIGRV